MTATGVELSDMAFWGLPLADSNIILSGSDPEFLSHDLDQAVVQILGAGQALAELVTGLAADRAQAPADDLVSALVTANIDGEQLTSAELASFFILLVVAGNETTRTALSHALMLLTEFPEQRALLLADFENRIEGTVEEIWPVNQTVSCPASSTGSSGCTASCPADPGP